MQNQNNTHAPAYPTNSIRTFFLCLTLMIGAYGFWLMAFWPGILGQDSLAVLLEIAIPDNRSGKPAFWYYFIKILYSGHKLVEIPIGFFLLLSAILLSRIVSWTWNQGLKKTAIFLLIFICLAPHTIFFIGTLYPDGIYSIAATALLFEIWLSIRSRKISKASLIFIGLLFPIAAFARPNGIVFAIPVLCVIYIFWNQDRKSSALLTGILLGWISINSLANIQHKSSGHGAVYPLIIYETVNFMKPRPMNLWIASPRLSEKTISILQKNNPIEKYQKYYDPDYWDPLVFNNDGPKVMSFTRDEKKTLVKEFFLYNIWRNIPSFMGSRANIFLTSSLAQGGLPSHTYAQHIIPLVNSESKYRKFNLTGAEEFLFKMYDRSYGYRWLFWTPFLGLILLLACLNIGFKNKNVAFLVVSIPMLLQLGGIFIFSIAGEYRYILPFFMLPLVLLPAYLLHRRDISSN